MSRVSPKLVILLATTTLLIVAACTTPPDAYVPEPAPAPSRPDPPEPQSQPAPDPEPQPRAPLEGPVWILDSLYGTTRVPAPPPGSVSVTFTPESGFRAYTDLGTITGAYQVSGKNLLAVQGVVPETREGRFARFQSVLEENLALVKGYYITGEIREESRLTLYGGVGREEIILAQFHIKSEE